MIESLVPLDVAARMDRLRARLDVVGVDALVVTALSNVRYLTGFSGSAGVVVVTPSAAVLTTDGRYRTQSAEQVNDAGAKVEVVIGGLETQREAAKSVLTGIGRIGLEADDVSWSGSRRWQDLLGQELVATTGVVEELRQAKDAGEIDRMARAAGIADAALEEVLPIFGEAGKGTLTEERFALELDSAMRRGGAEGTAFETIVAAGPNSAKPHHRPSERTINLGDPVVVDFGAIFEGYRSDMTRTFSLGGAPDGELARIFSVVAESQRLGVEAVRTGVSTKDVDAACRSHIAEAGWAEAFEHGTGHGVGLDIHEAPTVSPLGTAILAPGYVVTVEPGVYLPGIGGVRIEDTLVVTEDGSRTLTNFTKECVA